MSADRCDLVVDILYADPRVNQFFVDGDRAKGLDMKTFGTREEMRRVWYMDVLPSIMKDHRTEISEWIHNTTKPELDKGYSYMRRLFYVYRDMKLKPPRALLILYPQAHDLVELADARTDGGGVL